MTSNLEKRVGAAFDASATRDDASTLRKGAAPVADRPLAHRKTVGLRSALAAAAVLLVAVAGVAVGRSVGHGPAASVARHANSASHVPPIPPPSGFTPSQNSGVRIDGLRTDADRTTLVASYIGGACDGPASLEVQESSTIVNATVVIARQGKKDQICPAIGIFRHVSAHLLSPLGDRKVYSLSIPIIPFDGGRLLIPTALPKAFTLRGEEGGIGEDSAQTSKPRRTLSWARTYGPPARSALASTCTPMRGVLVINQGPRSSGTQDAVDRGTRRVGAAKGHLYREGPSDAKAYRWTLVWPAAGGSVSVTALSECAGDHLLTPAELLAIARSLK